MVRTVLAMYYEEKRIQQIMDSIVFLKESKTISQKSDRKPLSKNNKVELSKELVDPYECFLAI